MHEAFPEVLEALGRKHSHLAGVGHAVASVWSDDAALYRINPYSFATTHALEPSRCLEWFLRAVSAGAFLFEWEVVCGGCGAIVDTVASLGAIDRHVYCDDCAVERTALLDDAVHVAFSPSPTVRTLRYREPDLLTAEEYFLATYFGSHIVLRDTGEDLREFLRRTMICAVKLQPGQTHEGTYDLGEGTLVGAPRHKAFVRGCSESAHPDAKQALELTYSDKAFEPYGQPLNAGPTRLSMTNASDQPVWVFSYVADRVPYFAYRPYLSGRELIGHPLFRELFADQMVVIADGLELSDITLMFTDLRASTALYERIGDPRAFELVSEHFRRVGHVIGVHRGTVVKTIGDAIMASFNRPADAVKAAVASVREVRELGRELAMDDLAIKIGIHRGPGFVVNVNNTIDYFGRTANLAARVQSCANAHEICLSEAIFEDPEVGPILAGHQGLESETVALKGVDDAVTIWRLRQSRPAAAAAD